MDRLSAPDPARRGHRGTATSTFGVGRRESHDATGFYQRFSAPVVDRDEAVCPPAERPDLDRVWVGDIRDHPGTLAPRSVALVVTSPPYYSGKEYETAIGEGHVPASYGEYLTMVSGVLAACVDALEPGGRMAVNVANLGRKPYRSLSADVIRMLEEDLGLLMRGEVVWRKARGAAGSCAWGTFQRPGDPVLRDLTERIVIASKGRFDRAIPPARRAALGYPSEATITRDEFLEATLDVWELPAESATRVGHPAPFPVALPRRLIELYTYRGDLILDPFMGAGSTALAALRSGRHFVGYETDAHYAAAALERIGVERRRLVAVDGRPDEDDVAPLLSLPSLPAVAAPGDPDEPPLVRARREGRRARELARWLLEDAGFTVTAEGKRVDGRVEVDLVAEDRAGNEWLFEVCGAFSSTSAGLQSTDAVWRSVGKAAVLRATRPGARCVVLTTAKPSRRSPAGRALASVTGGEGSATPIHDVIGLCEPGDLDRLAHYAGGPSR